jgi:hypothetical protein
MKMVALIGLFAGLTGNAGEISGTLKQGSSPVREGVVIDVACAGRPGVRAVTDRYGSYRLRVAEQGHCTLTVRHEGHSTALDIDVLGDALRYDLVLQEEGDRYTLRRE